MVVAAGGRLLQLTTACWRCTTLARVPGTLMPRSPNAISGAPVASRSPMCGRERLDAWRQRLHVREVQPRRGQKLIGAQGRAAQGHQCEPARASPKHAASWPAPACAQGTGALVSPVPLSAAGHRVQVMVTLVVLVPVALTPVWLIALPHLVCATFSTSEVVSLTSTFLNTSPAPRSPGGATP